MKHSIKITSLFILLIIFFSNNCVSQTNKKDKTNKINYKIMEYNKLTSFISGQGKGYYPQRHRTPLHRRISKQ